jgi:hypothetical protein
MEDEAAEFLGRKIQDLASIVSRRRTEVSPHVSTQPFQGFDDFPKLLGQFLLPMLGPTHDFLRRTR